MSLLVSLNMDVRYMLNTFVTNFLDRDLGMLICLVFKRISETEKLLEYVFEKIEKL